MTGDSTEGVAREGFPRLDFCTYLNLRVSEWRGLLQLKGQTDVAKTLGGKQAWPHCSWVAVEEFVGGLKR